MTEPFREQVLRSFGANTAVSEELLAYNKNAFDISMAVQSSVFPLEDEKFVSYWHRYQLESEEKGLFQVLQQKLVQLQFPVREGISQTDAYRSVTLRGTDTAPEVQNGLQFNRPDLLELQIHHTIAGGIPVLTSRSREDFVMLVQALAHKNEPVEIPESMGACMIAGYNNWDRIRDYRRVWENKQSRLPTEDNWKEEFKNLIPMKELYQDRFILLNDGPYSAVSAQSLGMSETEWIQKSLIIRREHESTHYLTRRIFSSMQNRMMDELIADYAGIVAASGYYRSDWFLRFVGLERYPEYRKGGRLENYRGNPVLSDAAFTILQSLLYTAANHLQLADEKLRNNVKTEQMVIALCFLTLEELASAQAIQRIESAIHRINLNHKK